MSLVPSFIAEIKPYVPGKPIEETEREYGLTGATKLASNENPLGPSPKAVAAMNAAMAKMHLYPDGASFYLKNKLAAKLGVTPAELMLGNGSNELIELFIRTFVHGDEEVLLSAQTFVVYKLSCMAVGRRFVEVPMHDRHYDLPAMAKAITPRTKLVFLANPDNPTGTYFGEAALVKFLEQVPAHVLVVMDEAYQEYVVAGDYPDTLKLRARFPNLVVSRTFSKIYGLAGVRLGYAVGTPEVSSFLDRTRAPFNVSAMAQAAGMGALDDDEFVKRTSALNREGLDFLSRELDKRGLKHWPSQTNFFLVELGRPGGELFEQLLRRGVITRPMGAYNFPTSLRVNTGTHEDHVKFLKALDEVLAK